MLLLRASRLVSRTRPRLLFEAHGRIALLLTALGKPRQSWRGAGLVRSDHSLGDGLCLCGSNDDVPIEAGFVEEIAS